MPNYMQPEFDRYRTWIDGERNRGRGWPEILLGKAGMELDAWLCGLVDFGDYPSLGATPEDRKLAWESIVTGKKDWEEKAARDGRVPVVVGPDAADRVVKVPTEARSSWQLYRSHLKNGGFRAETIDSIETSTIRILRRLRWQTAQPDDAVKGMVVGHVQSGKTASMAGLISMAMDWSWNLIIVLTGTIENLRVQTNDRLVSDLNHNGNVAVRAIHKPGPNSPFADRTANLDLGTGSASRYLVVSLKNATRLQHLKRWLESDSVKLGMMRILIIDDEADQASVNSSASKKDRDVDRQNRTRINRLIVELTQVRASCVNYVAYTATPYANFLNEAWYESLYPRNFIVALPQSTEHFGPKQVFGIAGTEAEGLNIVRDIPLADLRADPKAKLPATCMDELHADPESGLPQSLKEAVSWFLCATAAIRHQGDFRKPVSMLVHSSSRQQHHENVATAIKAWLCDKDVDHVATCRETWAERTADLSLKQFRARMPDYLAKGELADYPHFASLEPHIRTLLASITHIHMEENDGEPEPQYHRGVHICIDNCASNGIDDESQHLRLLYPRPEVLPGLGDGPAFLVVGGSTLSRGLTIENLVSSYFLRGGSQMDTLMQMGRWFGYRGGYELLPRIWMPADTRRKFVYMAGVEQELREELVLFQDGGRDPAEYGPRVRTHPSASWLRPTAANRMKDIKGARYDFSGTNKQLTIFHSHKDTAHLLLDNIEQSNEFLGGLGAGMQAASGSTLVWRGVDFRDVRTFLARHHFHGRARFFKEIGPFLDWFADQEANFDKWNVVVGGRAASGKKNGDWLLPSGQVIGKTGRSRLNDGSDAESVSIGVLRDPKDLLADAMKILEMPKGPSNAEIVRLRAEANLGNTPQLLLYRIDKDSVPTPKVDERSDLDTPEDLIGISIWVPGGKPSAKQNFTTHVAVRIPEELKSEQDDLEPSAED